MAFIVFSSHDQPYYWLSNFYPHMPFLHNGHEWRSSEHYYQAQKFLDLSKRDRIRFCRYPSDAAKLGREMPGLRQDWNNVKLNVMRTAIKAKFAEYPHYQDLLVKTGDATLVEYSWRDTFWGMNARGEGKNWLGVLLMELRKELHDASESINNNLHTASDNSSN